MNKPLKLILILVLLAGIGFGGYFTWKNFQKPASLPEVKVGVMIPLSGDTATYGFDMRKGIELAKKDLSAQSVELIYEDSGCEPGKAKTAIQKLLDQEVVAIIGEVCSGATLAIAPTANKEKVVLISPASTSPELSKKGGEYFFRTVPSDALQGDFGAKLAYDRGHRKLAILYTNESYGINFKDVLKESFKDLGGEVVTTQPMETASVDFTSQVKKIKSKDPDAVYIISNSPTSAGAAIVLLKEEEVKADIFGSEALNKQTLLDDVKGAAEGMIVTGPSLGTEKFQRKYRVEYGVEPGLFSAQAYDAFSVLVETLAAGALTGEEIKQELTSLEFEGVTGLVKFDEFGDVGGVYNVYVAEEGKFVPVKQ